MPPCAGRSRPLGRARSDRPRLQRPYSPARGHTLDSDCHARSPPPSGLHSRLVLGRTPRTLVAPRTGPISCGLLRPGRGADPLPAPQRGTVGSICLAAAPRPSSRLRLTPCINEFSPSRQALPAATTASADFSRSFSTCYHADSVVALVGVSSQSERPPRLSCCVFPSGLAGSTAHASE